ncbi:unnamed protein product [Cyprideis torosa]|uniref:Nondiscriminating glutamyl-tRNA synthetase EARS2, mitochondrial n=1 Tax=Cyprideis torosa TaxID=163714 RepID=A0A7R8WRR4_9CRUS|nr:unnamed protein product [Cyprideis torosa]CAG0904000.1 unnamed protein product [Cyprideis torosa]
MLLLFRRVTWCQRVQLKQCIRSSHVTVAPRVRFAPSPTGYLHLGGLRTALINYLFSRKHGGNFLLRIEDTDRSRLVPDAVDVLLEDLDWLGLKPDENPVVQSQRLEVYQREVQRLVELGFAYPCFCSQARLAALRREQSRSRHAVKGYDNHCRELTEEERDEKLKNKSEFTIRFKLDPSGISGFQDMIYGQVNYDVAGHEGDPIILKSDGFPTYHLANVVDDHDSQITHVLRGIEWQISTTKHLQIYKAFNWEPPKYGHLPVLLTTGRTKLSKRDGDMSIRALREQGYFPEVLINHVLQWQEPIPRTLPRLIQEFSLGDLNRNNSQLQKERMLLMNRSWIAEIFREDHQRLVQLVRRAVGDRATDWSDESILKMMSWALPRLTTLEDLHHSEGFRFLWGTSEVCSEDVKDIGAIQLLSDCLDPVDFPSLPTYENCDKEAKHFIDLLKTRTDNSHVKCLKAFRKVLTGLSKGPSVSELFGILGKVEIQRRLADKLCELEKGDVERPITAV